MAGPSVPGFELLGELGRGAAGVVFRAREVATGREVALKLLLGRLDAAHAERFRREGELTARLDHPGVVRVHGAGVLPGGAPFLVYELVDGRSLARALPGLPRAERLRLVVEACRAVGHAHARGVVHRDLKPENILVDAAGKARVADFGVSTGEGLDRLTLTGALVGTPAYASPEQLTGDRGRVGPASDVWSLGVILYELLTDALPFEAESLMQLVHDVLRPPRPPRELDPSIPPALEEVCLRALAVDPAARPADGRALAAALTVALRPPARRARAGLALAGALAGVAAVALLARSPAPEAATSPARSAPPATSSPATSSPAPSASPLVAHAEGGDRDAMLELAERLSATDAAAARGWFVRAAEAGAVTAAWRVLDDRRAEPGELAAIKFAMASQAQRGDPAAMCVLSQLLLGGRGGPRDPRAALGWLRRASDQGDVRAMALLGVLLGAGTDGIPKDAATALELLRGAATQGDRVGQRELGRRHLEGTDVDQDRSLAEELLRKAALQGDLDAMLLLRDAADGLRWLTKAAEAGHPRAMYELSRRVSGERRRAWLARAVDAEDPLALAARAGELLGAAQVADGVRLLERAAELDDQVAANVALSFALGANLVPRDRARALGWYRRLALRAPSWVENHTLLAEGADPPDREWALTLHLLVTGDASASVRAALLIEQGVRPERVADPGAEPPSAVDLWRRAWKLGDSSAALLLSDRFLRGEHGLQRDVPAALAELEAAGASKDPLVAVHALTHLTSRLMFGGPGVEDPVRARRTAERAAAMGNVDARHLLGHACQHGVGGPVDLPRAHRLFEETAALGNTNSMNSLAELLRAGTGAPVDLPRARELYRRSCEQGNGNSFFLFAEMLERGEGGPADLEGAARWYERAVKDKAWRAEEGAARLAALRAR